MSLALSSRSHPPSATPAALFISTSQQYPRAREAEKSEREGQERRSAALVSPVINFRPSTEERVDDNTIRDRSTAVSFVTLYREYERGRGAREDDMREASRDRFQRGELPNCSATRAFYFHEFRRTSARNHNQPFCQPPQPHPRPTPRLLWIVSRESNDRDEADEMERGLHVQLLKSIRRSVSPSSLVVVVVEILAGVQSRRDNVQCCRSNRDNKPLCLAAPSPLSLATHVLEMRILNALGSVSREELELCSNKRATYHTNKIRKQSDLFYYFPS